MQSLYFCVSQNIQRFSLLWIDIYTQEKKHLINYSIWTEFMLKSS